MRTTVTLDPDVADQLKQIMKHRKTTFEEAVNSTLRKGLSSGVGPRPYEVPSYPLGLKPGIDGDRIIHHIDETEDRYRRLSEV